VSSHQVVQLTPQQDVLFCQVTKQEADLQGMVYMMLMSCATVPDSLWCYTVVTSHEVAG
jgi:hypothetical protein